MFQVFVPVGEQATNDILGAESDGQTKAEANIETKPMKNVDKTRGDFELGKAGVVMVTTV